MYPGSINDVSQFKYMVDRAIDYNYKNIGFILDRGYLVGPTLSTWIKITLPSS
jgi:hypothetical protein